HGWVAAITVFVLSTTAWLMHALFGADSLAKATAGVAVGGPCVLLFWVARRTFYIELNPGGAVGSAAVYTAALLSGLAVCYRTHTLSPFTAFLIMAVAALITTPVLLIRLRPKFDPTPNAPSTKQIIQRHWQYGRWAVASSAATWGTTALLFVLLTSFRGLAATGELKALLNVASPIGTAFLAISMLSVSYGSRIYAERNPERMLKFAGWLTTLYMGGTAAYFLALTALRHPVLHLLYGNKYSDL